MARSIHKSRTFLGIVLVTGALWCAPQAGAETARTDVYAAPFVGGSPQWVSFVNDLVGWRPYAEAGFLGSSTVVGNVEAGQIWSGHEVFRRPPTSTNGYLIYSNPHALNQLDYHATMVGHVLAGTGFNGASYDFLGLGMAADAAVLSGSVATSFSSNSLGSFDTTYLSVVTPYRAFMTGQGVPRAADVINSSWGGGDPMAISPEAVALDGLAAQNRFSALVASAGNSTNAQVGWPGAGFNGITVGALGGMTYLAPTEFSSRGLADFYNPSTGTVVSNARVAVDIAAPGEHLYLAAYLGNQGGIPAALPGFVQQPSPTNLYFIDVGGTSFASPIVAGGLAVLKDVANRDAFWNLNGLTNAKDTRVAKSVLMAGALETFGWDNAQTRASNGVIVTTAALDRVAGAGAMDMGRSGDAYFFGTRDVPATNGGAITSAGWDFGTVGLGANNDYFFDGAFGQPAELTVSLNWFAGRSFDMETDLGSNLSFADLNLEVWEVAGGSFSSLVASSSTTYNNSEYLRLDLAGDKTYGLRVTFEDMVFDLTGSVTSESYGLAWVAKPYEALYWNGGATNGTWSGINTSWSAGAGTNAATDAITTALDQLVLAPGTNASLTVLIDGPQLARGISISNGAVFLTGTNNAAINLQSGGLNIAGTATGATVVASNVSLLISGGQAWSNASAFDLDVAGAVAGVGDLALRSSSNGGIVLSGSVNHDGALVNDGSGAATNRVSGVIGTNVTGVTQDSATSKLVLAGTNTYTGNTTVAKGELVVSGSIAASALTSVQSGGTLSGTGVLGDTIILNGGTGSPGSSPGTQTIAGDLTWIGGGNYNWQLQNALGSAGSSTGWDLYDVSGTLDLSALTLGSKFNINLWSLSVVAPDLNGNALNFNAGQNYTWIIVATDLGIVGFDPSEFNISVVANNGAAGFANDLLGGAFGLRVTGTNLELTFTAVPEPGTWAAAVALVAAAAGIRLRRAKLLRTGVFLLWDPLFASRAVSCRSGKTP